LEFNGCVRMKIIGGHSWVPQKQGIKIPLVVARLLNVLTKMANILIKTEKAFSFIRLSRINL